ncbi:RING-H2 finger protein ATL1-like [Primulina huaijiensis]|uniref:RING-H2 finger protein ATL1-like n=2 Tax=Primulina huaijiensis TaxID=1492673 RepID=UPI003CC76A8F
MERSQNTPETQSPQHLSNNGFPIIAILILAIAATAFLLISYYIFVTKRYFIWQQLDPLRRFSFRRTPPSVNPSASHSPLWQNQGLDESLIRELPTFQYSKSEFGHSSALWRCVVCLTDFQEHELLRVLPKCNHAFHLDCIDLWLQNCSNCPLCRSAISGRNRFRFDKILAPNSSPQDPQPMVGSEEDFAAIEQSGEDGNGGLANRQQERINLSSFLAQPRSHSSRKFEQNVGKSKPRQFQHVSIMGDENSHFSVQPIRRSFSMDSVVDRHVYLSVQQEIIRQNGDLSQVRSNEESSGRSQRSFFSIRHGRGSRNAVLPIEF